MSGRYDGILEGAIESIGILKTKGELLVGLGLVLAIAVGVKYCNDNHQQLLQRAYKRADRNCDSIVQDTEAMELANRLGVIQPNQAYTRTDIERLIKNASEGMLRKATESYNPE